MDRQIYRFLLLHSNLNLSDFLSFTLFKLVKIASFFIHRIEPLYWILNSNISVYYNYKLSSFMFTANYCYWTIVQKWFTLIQDATFFWPLSFDNQYIESSVIHCKYTYKWSIHRFEVAEEIKGKAAINIKIKCTHYKSHRSEHNFFFPMIHKGPGRQIWYTQNNLGEHRYTGFPDRRSLLGPLITKKWNVRIKTKQSCLFIKCFGTYTSSLKKPHLF